MKTDTTKINIIEPKSQLNLYGYNQYFSDFITLYKNSNLPRLMLLNGPKGLGKSTFAYHFINYLLSKDENNSYLINSFKIDFNNSSFKLIQNKTHPNFFSLDNILDSDIKIDQVRNLIKFLNKTSYSKNLKIVLIDNIEFLNINSSNALLKSLEEPKSNTYFFIIHNNLAILPETIRSRCLQFNFHFNLDEKKNIFRNIAKNYELNFTEENLDNFLYFETPGNFIKYLMILNDTKLDISKDYLSCISLLLDKCKKNKDSELLNFLSLLIEKFFNHASLIDSKNISHYYLNKNKISNLIRNAKKYNLDKNNLLFSIGNILRNET